MGTPAWSPSGEDSAVLGRGCHSAPLDQGTSRPSENVSQTLVRRRLPRPFQHWATNHPADPRRRHLFRLCQHCDITGHPHPHKGRLKMMEGTNMTFHVQMTPDEQTTSKETCSHCEPLKMRTKHGSMPLADSLPHEPSLPDNLTTSAKGTEFLGKAPLTRIRWNLHNASIMTPGWVIKAERVNEIEEAEDGTTLYRTWEAFGGLAANHVKKKYGEVLQARFQDWCRDLKKYAESKQEGG